MKRYVVVTDRATASEQDAIRGVLDGTEIAWWHHLSQTWLVVDAEDKFTAASLRDLFTKAAPSRSVLVLQATKFWAGHMAPKSFEWLDSEWSE